MKNELNLKRLNSLKSAALARMGQGYLPSRRRIIEGQNKWGMLHVVAKFISLNIKFRS